ncbi:MAG: enoyl-CoA hydratase-related protein [Candidatus Eisenbacteria bacterium]
MPDLILTHVAGGVATVTLNRPDKLNAFADDMRERLAEALDALTIRDDVRVLVLTGAGRAFCAGGDIKHMVALKERAESFESLGELLQAGRAVITRLAALPFPTLAAVNGPAAGAGLNLALACDLRVASDQATFGETFVRIGLHMDWGGTYFLPRLVGTSRALELCWLGDPVGADEALSLGLVNRVWAHAEFEPGWREWAARLAAAPATSVRLSKQSLRASARRTLTECLDAETAAQAACWRSTDSSEGLRAFMEKRAPVFAAVTPAAGAEESAWGTRGARFE